MKTVTKSESAIKNGHFLIGVDEYQRGDFFLLGATLASERQIVAVEKKWTALRKKIKLELIKAKPKLANHPKLIGDQLPEIHAVDMFQSGEYYRLNASEHPQYWLRQYRWMEEALAILKHYSLQHLYIPLPTNELRQLKSGALLVSLFEKESGITLSKNHTKEIIRRAEHPYIHAFAELMGSIDRLMSERGATAEVICDEYNDCAEFSILDCYDALRESGHLTGVRNPHFKSSHEETMIQAADLVCYVFGKAAYPSLQANRGIQDAREAHTSMFERWYKTYINPTDIKAEKYGVPGRTGLFNHTVGKLMLGEMILLRSGGSPEARARMQEAYMALLSSTIPK